MPAPDISAWLAAARAILEHSAGHPLPGRVRVVITAESGERAAYDLPPATQAGPRRRAIHRRILPLLTDAPQKAAALARKLRVRSQSYVRAALAELVSWGQARHVPGRGYARVHPASSGRVQ